MPINIPDCPAEVVGFLKKELSAFLKTESCFPNNGLELPGAGISEELPHQVYVLTLADIVSGKSPADARFTGWRHIIANGGRKFAAEIMGDEQGQNQQFAGTHEGALVKSFLATLRVMQKHKIVAGRTYELRLLKIPALYVMALWLKSLNDADDLIVPLAPTHHALKPGKPYTRKEFMDVIREPAGQMAAESRMIGPP